MKTHRDLDVWRTSMEMAVKTYRTTETFPKHELYGLVAQLRRAAVSVSSNIAEGAASQTRKEFVQFLYCSLGSAAEIETQFELAKMLGYITDLDVEPLLQLRERVSQMLYGLIRKLKS